jgi:hypothetical protein
MRGHYRIEGTCKCLYGSLTMVRFVCWDIYVQRRPVLALGHSLVVGKAHNKATRAKDGSHLSAFYLAK